jgi:hypothetical protein
MQARAAVLVLVNLLLLASLVRQAVAQYNAVYATTPVGPVVAGDTVFIPVKVTNTGTAVWNHTGQCAVTLGYHWLDRQTRVASETQATPLPGPIGPGQTVALSATVTAPSAPGVYTLAWDMRGRCEWFSSLRVAPGTQQVQVVPRR